MARPHPLPPSASSLSASMRDLGYSLETAVADIVDNSISAEATEIAVFCNLRLQAPTLVITDNGRGMDSETIITAMRHGAANPRLARSPRDLGRFGLGLKTASFSQCRRLTVISSQNGKRCGAEWDLDLIDKEDDWILSILDEEDIEVLPFIEKLGSDGTIVIWRQLDRLFEDETSQKRDEIVNEKLDILEKHLSLVFHRFLSGELKGRKKIAIGVNGHRVEPFDPFCRKSGSEMLPEEIVRIGPDSVHMQPYILPHHSRLSAKEYDYYQSRSDFISNQGAYIYRNGRLMAWGDWFRLIPKGEATKLARVQIDFPSTLDEMWTIDIKKSRARPPHAVRERLRQIIPRITGRSTTVHRGRGQKLFEDVHAPVWERYADQSGIRYSINLNHALVRAVSGRLDEEGSRALRLMLDSIGHALPVEMIYSDYSTQPRDVRNAPVGNEEVIARLRELRLILFGESIPQAGEFMNIIRSTRMFDDKIELVQQFIGEELA
ncbi:ATP-binding protein [Mesorhizobium sp. L103C105A0]|uniref:ATP-binding protein n=1 Tax=Mesorhizobium sp. L103C105A0 TaxID=1287074 RepID=UPI0003CFE778|nr:ATP-binding protein [Mesorhizobium sp. L103C105A0]ESZ78371.1 ATPase [Mesorhizobium sp. L103C105A0]